MAKQSGTIDQFLSLSKRFAAKDWVPLILLQGEETWFVDALTSIIEDGVLTEAEKSFNQTILYGKDTKPNELVSIVRRYPMMSNYQLVVVREAQQMESLDILLPYFETPLPSTILVLAFKDSKMDSRTKIYKAIAKGVVYTADKLRDYQIKGWIPQFCHLKGRSIDNAAVDMLVDLLGADLTLIHNELEKMFITVKDEFIRQHHIEQQVGFNREYNVFELQSALGMKDFNRSIQIAHQMGVRAERGEIHRMVPVLFGFFNKVMFAHYLAGKTDQEMATELGVNPYFVKDYRLAALNYNMNDLEKALGQIKYLDLRLKGVHRGSAEDGDLLVETVLGILKN
ncbi:MAG: DNA polymerase III subunit delta [Bacteroidetes bacterium]|nr:DNA polymerase III subunit delta [Bacteroidota bacterium]